MTEKEKLLNNLIEKSDKSTDEIQKLVADKVNELSGLVSEEGAIYIIANDLGVRLDADKPKKDADLVKIEEITQPKTPISFACKVIRIYDLINFSNSKGTQGSVRSVLVGDETGIIRVVFWNDKTELLENIHESDILKITNAYTRENTNSERIEIHYGQYSDIEVNPKDLEIKLKEMPTSQIDFTAKKISEITEEDKNISIKATITDFDIPRFYLACPECFKKVFQDEGTFKCAEHNEVEAIKVPIVNLIVDDGSGSLSVVSFRDRAEKIVNMKSNEIISLTEDVDKYRNFSKAIIGSSVEVAGNIGLNNMTGEKQLLVNQILNVEIKTIEEVTEELIEEDKKEKEGENNVEKNKEKENNKKTSDDDIDIEIEEIDIDDDLL